MTHLLSLSAASAWLAASARRLVVPILVVALVLTGPVGVSRAIGQDDRGTPVASSEAMRSLEAAIAWLVTQQAADGGFVGFSGTSDPGTTADAVTALAAARAAGVEVGVSLEAALSYLNGQQSAYVEAGVGQAAKLSLAYLAAGRLDQSRDIVDGLALVGPSATPVPAAVYGTGIFDHALVMLALSGSGRAVPGAAVAALETTQGEDGSWAFDGSTTPGAGDSNTTALVLQALAVTGRADDPMVAKALDFLRTAQAPTGGFAFQPAEPLLPDANSTALAVQALVSLDLDPSSPDLLDAASALAAFQNPSGAFRYTDDQPDDNLFATLQAIPAMAGLPLPVVTGGMEGATPLASPVAGVAIRTHAAQHDLRSVA
ncbi:MAG: cell wall anchor protein [Chloroflexota bacterium]|nr:cell wall anchor protein [Chloroflexota bacterium]